MIEPNGKSREHRPDARAEGQLSAGVEADVRAATFGDAEAFERLYRAHVTRVYGLACRMAGSERADELTQDVFVRAWEKLGTFRGESAFSSWLYRLAVNLLCSRLRALKLQREREMANEIPLAVARARHDSIEIRLDFEVALERLPDGAREVSSSTIRGSSASVNRRRARASSVPTDPGATSIASAISAYRNPSSLINSN